MTARTTSLELWSANVDHELTSLCRMCDCQSGVPAAQDWYSMVPVYHHVLGDEWITVAHCVGCVEKVS
jgi:predicted alpha/beta hydrolase family esterase